jgi:hypothetical protein
MAKITKFKSAFAQVPNALLQDGKLSFKARGLWAYMQSLPDDWDFSVERIAEGKDGKDAVRSGLLELEAAGYLERRKYSVGAGGSETEYVLKFASAENPPMETVPSAENPPAGNPPVDIGITKKQIADKEIESQGTIVPTAQAPGDPGISALIFEIKCHCEKHGWAYDRKDDRRMARHILTAKEFKAQADMCGMAQHSYAVAIVMASALLDFWRGKICGPAAIYRHHAKVYNEAKELKNRNVTPHFKTL